MPPREVECLTLLCAVDEIPMVGGLRVELASRLPVAVFRVGDEFFVTDDLCTHAGASMAEGEVVDGRLRCPVHAGEFDLRTGKALCFPVSKDLCIYPVLVEDKKVFALIEENAQ